MFQPLWKIVWQFLKQLKIELTYDLAIPLLGIYLKELKTGYSNENLCVSERLQQLYSQEPKVEPNQMPTN